MKVLSIDTSCKTAMAAVTEDGTVLASVSVQDHKTHSVKLLPAIAYILDAADTKPEALGLIAVTNGPGSYTGLRIGVTTAKTFAYTLGIPLIGVNTLEALAAACIPTDGVLVCPVIDARNARVYTALYEGARECIPPAALTCEMLCARLKAEYAGREIRFIGDGISVNSAQLAAQLGRMYRPVPPAFALGNPAAIALLAQQKYRTAEAAGTLGKYTSECLKVEYYKNYTDTI